jgi:hypothetical protein
MALYFFDLRSGEEFSADETGMELLDAATAHDTALAALVEIVQEAIVEGSIGQRFKVEVRNGIGPVLEITAVFDSTIFRKQ